MPVMNDTMTREEIGASGRRRSALSSAALATYVIWALALVLVTASCLACATAVERVVVAIVANVEGVLAVVWLGFTLQVTLFVVNVAIARNRKQVSRVIFFMKLHSFILK